MIPSPDVLVIGGGIIGMSAARELSRRGMAVELVEPGRPGDEASHAAAGLLAPLADAPEVDAFYRDCSDARDLWPAWMEELAAETGETIEFDRSGTLAVARSEADVAAFSRLVATARRLGEPVGEVDLKWLAHQVPDLGAAIAAAFHFSAEGWVENRDVCRALRGALETSEVRLTLGPRVESVEELPGGVRVEAADWHRDAGHVVLAAGAWSGGIAGLPPVPTRPVRGQIIRYEGVTWPWHGSVRGPENYAIRRGEGGLMIGATVEEVGFERGTTPEGVAELRRFAEAMFPVLAEREPDTSWSGLRPGSPDELPILGPLGDPRTIVATGHYRNGILLAPWTALRVAELVSGTGAATDLSPYSPARFVV